MTRPRPVAVIAGAGSGIGRGCALRLAREGHALVLVGRDAAKLAETAAQAGGDATVFPADLRDWDRMEELGRLVEPEGIDLLINSAGGQFPARAEDLSQRGWQAVIDTNLNGSFYLCRQLLPALRRRRGAVVTVAADLWKRPSADLAHASAARAGVVNLMKVLALEWAADDIRVNVVSPGLTDTPALRDLYKPMVERVPLGRMGTIDEVVDAILFLARAAYITGEVLTVDGGLQLA